MSPGHIRWDIPPDGGRLGCSWWMEGREVWDWCEGVACPSLDGDDGIRRPLEVLPECISVGMGLSTQKTAGKAQGQGGRKHESNRDMVDPHKLLCIRLYH